jgi:hypothetical protein
LLRRSICLVVAGRHSGHAGRKTRCFLGAVRPDRQIETIALGNGQRGAGRYCDMPTYMLPSEYQLCQGLKERFPFSLGQESRRAGNTPDQDDRERPGKGQGGAKPVRSRVGSALWLFATLLVASWGSTGGLQVRPEPLSVHHGAASLTPEAPAAQRSVLPRGLPRVLASETDRQKLIPGQGGKSFGIIPEELVLVVTRRRSTPIPHSDVLWSVLVGAFEPRGPPSLIA